MNRVTKKKKKQRKKAFFARLRRLCCCTGGNDKEVKASTSKSTVSVIHKADKACEKIEPIESRPVPTGEKAVPYEQDAPNQADIPQKLETLLDKETSSPKESFIQATPAQYVTSVGPEAPAQPVTSVGPEASAQPVTTVGPEVTAQPVNAVVPKPLSQSVNCLGEETTSSTLTSVEEEAPLECVNFLKAQPPVHKVSSSPGTFSPLPHEMTTKTASESNVSDKKRKRDRKGNVLPVVSSQQASYHQGSFFRFSSPWAGNQCTTMALTALALSVSKPVDTWDRKSLNHLLKDGDRNHGRLLASLGRDAKLVHDTESLRVALYELKGKIPIQVDTQYHILQAAPNTEAVGVIKGETTQNELETATLAEALETALEGTLGAVVTVGEYSTAVLKDKAGYKLWDSHCRNKTGFSSYRGTAVLLTFDSLQDVQEHMELTNNRKGLQMFDVVGFHLKQEHQTNSVASLW